MTLTNEQFAAIVDGSAEPAVRRTVLTRLVEQIERLQAAIRRHRDQGGDDRCWEDDNELYAVLPEPNPRRVNDCSPERMLENCKRYIASRHDPSTPYVSPQREIERLRGIVAMREGTIQMAADRLEGLVEGQPTHAGNLLQRVDELRRLETAGDALADTLVRNGTYLDTESLVALAAYREARR